MSYLRYLGQKSARGFKALPLIPPPTPVAPVYTINNSLRLRNAIGGFLTRTPAVAGNQRTWTWSGWVKRGTSGGGGLLIAYASLGNGFQFKFLNDQLTAFSENANTMAWSITTDAVYRDFAAWYHIVLSYDTTQATASDRVRLFVNGIQVTAFATANYPAQNYQDYINRAIAHNMGARVLVPDNFFDGYFSEINFVDGQALAATSFGVQNDIYGWEPIGYTGTYGGLGYFLDMQGVRVVGGTIMSSYGVVILASTSWTVPSGVLQIKVLGCGGAGGGGGGGDPYSGGQGGSAGVGFGWLAVTPGQTIAVTIGNGGAGGLANTDNATDGTDTVFSTFTFGRGFRGRAGSHVSPGANGANGTVTGATQLIYNQFAVRGNGGAAGQGGSPNYDGGNGTPGIVVIEW